MSRYVGYDHDPLPPDPFRLSFGPPKREPRRKPAQGVSQGAALAPAPVAKLPSIPSKPRVRAYEPAPTLARAPIAHPVVPPAPPPIAAKVAAPIAAEPAPRAEPAKPAPLLAAPRPGHAQVAGRPMLPPEPRPARLLRGERAPRAPQVQAFPTLRPLLAQAPSPQPSPLPSPLPSPMSRPVPSPRPSIGQTPGGGALAALAQATRALAGWPLLVLQAVAAGLLLGPLSLVLGWLGLPGSAAEFLMTWPGRQAWQLFGGADAMVLYWLLLGPLAWVLTAPPSWRLPLLLPGVLYWVWQLLA